MSTLQEAINIVCPHCHGVNKIPKKDSYKKISCGKCKESILDTEPINVNEENFDRHLVNNDIPVVVDFWAQWCGPCKMMAPTFQSVAQKYPAKVRFIKLNTEEYQEVAERYRISGIPTMIMFKNGVAIDRVSGALPANQMQEWINKII